MIFIISTDTRIHAIQVFHIFFKLIRVPKFLESLIKLKIKIIKNGNSSLIIGIQNQQLAMLFKECVIAILFKECAIAILLKECVTSLTILGTIYEISHGLWNV